MERLGDPCGWDEFADMKRFCMCDIDNAAEAAVHTAANPEGGFFYYTFGNHYFTQILNPTKTSAASTMKRTYTLSNKGQLEVMSMVRF